MRGVFGVLDRHVLVRLLAVWGLCILGFLLLFLVVDVTSHIDEIMSASDALEAAGRSTWGVAVQYYGAKIPVIASMVGPYLTLFAGIATLLSLARNNEYVPMIMAGRSVHRVLLPVYVFAVATVLLFAAAEEYVVPGATRQNAILGRLIDKKGRVELKKIPHMRDRGNVFAVGRWNPERKTLLEVSCPVFKDPDGKLPSGSLEIAELSWRTHKGVVGWYPKNAVLTPRDLGEGGTVQSTMRLPPDKVVPFRFVPEEIEILAAAGEPGITRAQLVKFRELHPQQYGLTVELHSRITRPLSSLVLLLLGIPFVAGPVKKSIAHGLGVALFCCVAYFFTDVLFRELGGRGAINPVVASWTPAILFTALAAALYDSIVT